MSLIWDNLINVQQLLEEKFSKSGNEVFEPGMDRFNQPGWVNRVWSSPEYRRAHVDVVDARESKGLWMMHCCIFPHLHNSAPIFGFDVIAGKNKITGCFVDFSPTTDRDHEMIDYFFNATKDYAWIKKRELPDWARRIFSPHMVAVGNIKQETELLQITSLADTLSSYYLETVGNTNYLIQDSKKEQNFYATNQKQNPHTPKVMVSLGLSEDDVRVFIQDCLFPEIK